MNTVVPSIRSLFPQRLMGTTKKGPYWTVSRGSSICSQCGDDIKDGEKIVVLPSGKGIFCSRKGCGLDMLNAQNEIKI